MPGFDVSRDVIRYCLRHQLGYRWGKVRKKKRRDEDRPATLRSYLLRYSAALALERAGLAVIVYFDEVWHNALADILACLLCSASPHVFVVAATLS